MYPIDSFGTSLIFNIINSWQHLNRIPKTNDAILQKAAHTFAQSALAPLSIQKRKKGSIIPVQVFHLFTVFLVSHEKYVLHKTLKIWQMTMQVTSRARRVYKIRGSQAVPSGRPRQDGKVTKQLVITDDNEELFFKLPGPKKRLQKIKHNLMDLVKNGRGADKKHWNTFQKLKRKKTRIDYIKD